jgi:hypothetical protein
MPFHAPAAALRHELSLKRLDGGLKLGTRLVSVGQSHLLGCQTRMALRELHLQFGDAVQCRRPDGNAPHSCRQLVYRVPQRRSKGR